MIVAAPNPTDAADEAASNLAGEILAAGGELLVWLLAELGVQGVAVLLAVGAVVLTVKSKAFRKAEGRALRAGFRYAWRLLVWLVARIRGRVGTAPSKEERRLLARLTPAHWREHAEQRGLQGTLTGKARLTDAGIVVPVRLDGKWTVGKLRDAEDHVRSLLGARTGLRVEVAPGKRGGWAQLTLRTRSAVDGTDMKWSPGCKGVGLDAHTGKPVDLPDAQRFLLAGSSGAGKSVSLRPWLARQCADDRTAVVMVDLKRVEGALWRNRVRVTRDADETDQVAVELDAEMMERLQLLEDTGKASWTPTRERPRIYVVVDEGAEVMKLTPKAVERLESIARMGRAAEIHLVWCTQKPTMSGASAGIPPQIAAQADVMAALKLKSPTECRTVFGEDATAEGWDAHTLAKPGHLMIRGTGRGAAPVKVWFMDDDTVRKLPPAPVWRRGGDDEAPTVELPAVRLVKTPAPEPDSETRVLAALADGVDQVPALVDRTGLSRATVNRLLAALVDTGRARRVDRGRYAAAV